jgi:hypothetical protein
MTTLSAIMYFIESNGDGAFFLYVVDRPFARQLEVKAKNWPYKETVPRES